MLSAASRAHFFHSACKVQVVRIPSVKRGGGGGESAQRAGGHAGRQRVYGVVRLVALHGVGALELTRDCVCGSGVVDAAAARCRWPCGNSGRSKVSCHTQRILC